MDQDIEDGKTSGMFHKINAQVSYWKKYNVNVQLLTLYSFKQYNSDFKLIDESKSFNIRIHNKYVTLFRMIFSTYKLLFKIWQFRTDVVYMRVRPYIPFTRFIFRKRKIIIELNTNDILEWRLVNKPMYIYNLLTRDLFYSIADKFIAVGNEIRNLYLTYGKEIKVIGNSVDVKKIDLVEDTKNIRPQVTFVGSPGFKWNGIDKIKWLASKLSFADFILLEKQERIQKI